MNKSNKIFFAIAIITYIIIQLWRQTSLPIPKYINSYLTDLACMPIVFGICTFLISKIKNRFIFVNFNTTTLLTLNFALLFEIILPVQSQKYTADFYDIIIYLTGAYIYFFIQHSESNIKTDNYSIVT